MIYAISDGEKIKIGYSKHPEKRLKQLQTAHPAPLKLIQTWQGDKILEKAIHHRLFSFRSRLNGEWFNLNHSHLSVIDSIISAYKKT